MKVLVTGGSGLVGRAFQQCTHAREQFYFPSSKDFNLLDPQQSDEMVKLFSPDCMIHLAANVGGLFKNMNQKVQMFEDNMRMNMNVVSSCHKGGVNRFVGMLSTCIFPDKTTYPIDETMLHNGSPHCSNDAYAYAKRMLQVQCQAYNEQYGVNYGCVIPSNIYGEYDNYNLQDAHVIPALIHKCLLAKKNDKPFIIKGTGKPLRQFIYSQDLARAILSVLDKINDRCIIIRGDGQEHSIGDIARYIARHFDYESNMQFDTRASDGQYKKTADGKEFTKLNPEFVYTPIEEGLKRSIDWFVKTYPKCRI